MVAIKKAILLSRTSQFNSGAVILHAGSMGRDMFLILDGTVDVKVGEGRTQRKIATLNVGQVFGEIGFVGEFRRSADVVAREKTQLLRINFDQVQSNMRFYPRIAAKINLNISRILGERLAKTTKDHREIFS